VRMMPAFELNVGESGFKVGHAHSNAGFRPAAARETFQESVRGARPRCLRRNHAGPGQEAARVQFAATMSDH
jgi:hypothetical protein